MFKFDYGKYKGILISVALFLLLDASVLTLNFYISFEIADDALSVNLAGRQRMLSQRMAKALFIMESTEANEERYQSALKELELSQVLFDETLTAFYKGGKARSAGNESVELQKVSTLEGMSAMEDALVIWTPYNAAISNFISASAHQEQSDHLLQVAGALASAHNLQLLKLMNDLTINLEQLASSKATRLRIIQTAGISLALINFFFIMFHFVRQLKDSDVVLEKARRETTEILETVNEGLFLIDKNFVIGEQHSRQLHAMLGDENIAGKQLQYVLQGIVSEKDASTASSFIDLLFSEKVKEKLIGDLNPLQVVEINVANKEGTFTTKYLSFSFARAYNENQISHVLVTVVDITEKVKLEKALLESQKQNENQLQMLTSLLHTNPLMLNEFIESAHIFFAEVNAELKKNSKNVSELREKSQRIFRQVHNFKGEASALRLDYYENAAHLMENTLALILDSINPSGNDFLSFAVQLEQLISYTSQVEQLARKLGEFGKKVSDGSEVPDQDMASETPVSLSTNFEDLVAHLAQRNNKLVSLVSSGLNDLLLEREYGQQIKSICIQLLRNSVLHGIESPQDRVLKNKREKARIDLRIARIESDKLEITIEDDGQGINYSNLREKALTLGKWTSEEVQSWSNRKLLALIFKDGFSTAEEISKDAGRGVGLGAVAECINRYGGKLAISSKAGQYCRFSITMPLLAA